MTESKLRVHMDLCKNCGRMKAVGPCPHCNDQAPKFTRIAMLTPTTGRPNYVTCMCKETTILDYNGRPYTSPSGKSTIINVGSLWGMSSNLPMNRRRMVESALKANVDYVMWIDGDMYFPRTALKRLLDAEKDIVGVNAVIKKIPAEPHALGMDNEPLYTDASSTGLVKARRIGFGVVLMKADVFRKIPKPWFVIPWGEDIDQEIGEDHYFFDKAINHGYDLWVDHDLSKEVKHIGDFNYGVEHCFHDGVPVVRAELVKA